MSKLTLGRLYNTNFSNIYSKMLINEQPLDENEKASILALAVYFVNLDNVDLNELGYRLFILYSNRTRNYKPLYEISINKGLIPIAEFIRNTEEYDENIHTLVNSAINIEFQRGDIYFTVEQDRLYKASTKHQGDTQVLIAPTSYGKTELIMSFIKSNRTKNICVITPTKSLLAQTKKRIINELGNIKIITQPEMYTGRENNIIAVLTQERLIRFLQERVDFSFDVLIVDEAHNLLDEFKDDSTRSVLLASSIIANYNRNPKTICKYLTPFVKSAESLQLKFTDDEKNTFQIIEKVKSETFFFYDLTGGKGSKYILDQYSASEDKLIEITNFDARNESQIIFDNRDNKNIIYLNKPKDLETFAVELVEYINNQDNVLMHNSKINKAVNDLRDFIHKDYLLADCLASGVIYHHGSVPDSIRIFIEDLYAEENGLDFLITNSTLLQGVNLPATKMFVLDPSKGRGTMSPPDFKNLIGRICRFSEIFHPSKGNLNYLLPEIHIIKGKYTRKDLNIKKLYKKFNLWVGDEGKIEDVVKNPLLMNNTEENTQKTVKAKEIMENLFDENIVRETDIRKPSTNIGKASFKNNIRIFDVIEHEEAMQFALNEFTSINDLNNLFIAMGIIFFNRISEEYNVQNNESHANIKRLQNKEAQKYYVMLLDWRIRGISMGEMIKKTITYWNSLSDEEASYVFVGRWGDRTRGGHREFWTNMKEKTEKEKVNLAIVRLKEEYDFIDNELIKYVEVLNVVGILEEHFYLEVKYGTSDTKKITMLNCGLSSLLINTLTDKYSGFIEIDLSRKLVNFEDGIIEKMIQNNENGILISEVKLNIKEK